MSKHKKKGQIIQDPQAAQPSVLDGQPAPAEIPAETAVSETAGPDIPKTYFFIFWGLIIIAVALAWTLAVLLPDVRESIIERCILLALAGALGALLLIYK